MHEKRFNGDPDRLRSPQRLELLEVDRVVNQVLKGVHAASLLDVGTGSGLFAEAFHKRGLQVAGLDVSQRMLKLAIQYVPEAELRVGTAEELPFPDAYCDLVFMGLLLHETDDPFQALKEARRVGRIRTAALEWQYVADPEFGPPLEHRLDEKTIRKWSMQAGFTRFERIELQHLALYLMDVG
jgi:ubiquinone/menaquinone biosynthesis C-methylase UbiE